MHSSDDRQVLDTGHLVQYTGHDEGIAHRVYRQFLEQTKSDVSALRAALAGSDAAEIAAAAHRVRSSSLMVGAFGQSGVAERIERAAESGDLSSARGAQDELEREHARLLERLATLAA